MLVVGTYPDGISGGSSDEKKLDVLSKYLDALLPPNTIVHLLPFYPSSGDYGFAPDNWYQIRDDLGDWKDLKKFSSKWRVLVDGIYNHVGVNHSWVVNFVPSDSESDLFLHAYHVASADCGPISPRGQPVLNEHSSGYYLWQTFSRAAVDIRLESSAVQGEISQHLAFLRKAGAWGIRLDAVAYYSKSLSGPIRHNSGCYALAERLADKVSEFDMKPFAQIDCDVDGIRYYSSPDYSNIPINDFTYSSYLALSILDRSPEALVEHIERSSFQNRVVMRAPRTHDGILLRSKLLKKDDKERLLKFAKSKNLPVRVSNEEPYELNCSAPYLYSLMASDVEVRDLIKFTLAITAMMPGGCYFYLPYLLGYIPEMMVQDLGSEDPRALNRQPIDKKFIDALNKKGYLGQLHSLLTVFLSLHDKDNRSLNSVLSVDGRMLVADVEELNYRLIANFGESVLVSELPVKGKVVASCRCENEELLYMGFILISLN